MAYKIKMPNFEFWTHAIVIRHAYTNLHFYILLAKIYLCESCFLPSKREQSEFLFSWKTTSISILKSTLGRDCRRFQRYTEVKLASDTSFLEKFRLAQRESGFLRTLQNDVFDVNSTGNCVLKDAVVVRFCKSIILLFGENNDDYEIIV